MTFYTIRKETQNPPTVTKISKKVALHLVRTVRHYYPGLASMIGSRVSDLRDSRGKIYTMHEAVLSVVMMFLLREGSRNSYNQDRAEPRFNRNIRRFFGIRLMHGDGFNDVMSLVDTEDLQRLKASLVKVLVARKVFQPYRHNGKHTVAVDGTGTHGFEEDYSGTCLCRTSKNGVSTYSHAVLEAKLVAANGFCISLASVWLENNDMGIHDKQDCELKAFKRLAVRLKELYPRLPMLIVADALYANLPVMDLCRDRGWDFMVVLKEGVLREVGEETVLRPDRKSEKTPRGSISYLNDLQHGGHTLSWLCLEEAGNRFSWVTNITISGAGMATEMAGFGRLRWKIENEGFNTQKNHGYNLEHKYSRTDFNATKNYYQCMQIAHLFEQLTLLAKETQKLLPGKTSVAKICERIRNILALVNIDHKPIMALLAKRVQIRFE